MAGEGSSAFEVEEGEKLIVLSVRKDESVSSATENQYWGIPCSKLHLGVIGRI